MALVRWALLAVMALVAVLSVVSYVASAAPSVVPAQTHAKYICPMHPQVTSDEPGECPICHMTLVPAPAGQPGGAETPSHPRAPAAQTPSASASASPGQPPAGTVPVRLTLDRVQAIGVRTALVGTTKSADKVRVTASVEAPEQGRAEVHTRSEGFVEALSVKQSGVKVRAGQLLASVYSPAIFQAEQELLAMRRWAAGSTAPIDEAKKRLELLGFGSPSIDKILETGQPVRAVGVYAPIAGYIARKNVVLGSTVTPETTLFEIVDLSKVYVIASVHPHQLAAIHVGDAASFTTPSVAQRVFEAKVDLIYPDVDLTTRTTRVRFQVKNDDLALRPGQFGTAELAAVASEALTVPLDAVIDTGRSVYVFVDEGEGRFSPRSIELGEQTGDRYLVLSGLDAGERVVSGATFLVDAESRIEASFVREQSAEAGSGAAPPPPAAGSCDAEFDRATYPDKWAACKKCEAHRGMGNMEQDCRNAIPKPWR